MMTISQAARKFGLSRSTLLFYESIGILKASIRSDSNYRKYSPEDLGRLEQICHYRKTGLSLKDIKGLLEAPGLRTAAILEKRLEEVNREIGALRSQQQVILRIMKKRTLVKKSRVMNKKAWVNILKAAGLTDAEMDQWHVEFERQSPEAHQDFLESLGIPDERIAQIRRRARG